MPLILHAESTCDICFENFDYDHPDRRPNVVSKCGHVFCQSCLSDQKSCFVCRKKIGKADVQVLRGERRQEDERTLEEHSLLRRLALCPLNAVIDDGLYSDVKGYVCGLSDSEKRKDPVCRLWYIISKINAHQQGDGSVQGHAISQHRNEADQSGSPSESPSHDTEWINNRLIRPLPARARNNISQANEYPHPSVSSVYIVNHYPAPVVETGVPPPPSLPSYPDSDPFPRPSAPQMSNFPQVLSSYVPLGYGGNYSWDPLPSTSAYGVGNTSLAAPHPSSSSGNTYLTPDASLLFGDGPGSVNQGQITMLRADDVPVGLPAYLSS